MYGILGEGKSDVETLKVLIKRLAADESVTVKTKGYGSCGEMLKNGWKQLKLFKNLGCHYLIICYDADGETPQKRSQEIVKNIVKPSNLKQIICIVIPVQELEAWILADIEAVTCIFKSWQPKAIPNPESIANPKEYLEKLSRTAQGKPLYSHAIHNEKVAKHLDLDRIKQKCPSFKPLIDLVTLKLGNYQP